MMDYQEIIAKLSALDLTTLPHDEISALISQFERFGIVEMRLHKGKELIRCRPSIPGRPFTNRAELSYVPPVKNTKYQRASTPFNTMFYGVPIVEQAKDEEVSNARIVSALETARLLRNPSQEGEELLTFSKWEVTDDIPLVAVCYHKDFIQQSRETKELYEAYHAWVDTLPAALHLSSIATTEYLAGEFAKRMTGKEHEYMISAVFSEFAKRKGHAGVYYPSVRADGKAFNVAISPEYVDSCLKLTAAGECTLYKRGNQVIGDNENICLIDDDSKPFTFSPVDPKYHVGRDLILQELGHRVT